MMQMLKREVYLNRFYFLLVFFTFPLIHGAVYPLLVFISILGFSIYNSFYCDYKNQTNRSFVSMPIKKEHIVLARYSFLIFAITLSLFYLWFIDSFAQYGFPPLDSGKLNGLSIFFMSILLGLALSVLIPFFYFFQSFQKPFIIQSFLILISLVVFLIFTTNPYLYDSTFIRTILDIIAIQPFLIPIVFAGGCLYLSYKLSAYFFNNRDII